VSVILTILSAWLLADFLSGLFHWYEDRLLIEPSRFKLIEQIRIDNELHHVQPYAMTRLPWVDNIYQSVYVASPVSLCLSLAGAPVVISLAILFLGFANLVHRWAHIHPKKLNRFIRFMQSLGLFICFDHHNSHHFSEGTGRITKENSTSHYCVMTCWLNPILDRIRFFKFLELIFMRRK